MRYGKSILRFVQQKGVHQIVIIPSPIVAHANSTPSNSTKIKEARIDFT